MKQILIQEVTANSYYSAPLYLDGRYILLTPDTPLTSELIARLNQWGYHSLFTEGVETQGPQQIVTPGLDNNLSSVMAVDIEEQEKLKKILAFYNRLITYLDALVNRFIDKEHVSINDITDKVKECITMIKEKKKYILSFPNLIASEENYIISHSVKSALLAIAIADQLKLPIHKQIEIGIAGLLHELGMMQIPKEIYMKSGELTAQEKKTILAHPILGFKTLKEYSFPMAISISVLEHHERTDGGGYPRQLTGEKTTLYGKIIALACAYTASVSQRPYKKALNGHNSVMQILKSMGKDSDERITGALIQVLSLYPLGTYVKLSNGMTGVVSDTNPQNPKFPLVQVTHEKDGVPFDKQQTIQTKATDGMRIVRSLNDEEVKQLKKQ